MSLQVQGNSSKPKTAWQRRVEQRHEQKGRPPTSETMRTQLDNCEKQLKAGRLLPDVKRSLIDRIATLKNQLGDE
ncbi:MAG: hypothetical protein WAV09_02480 [Minisyncoccia bacterium]